MTKPQALNVLQEMQKWREDDYDGYNDYYVNPEYHRSETTRKRVEQQDEKDDEQRTTTQDRRQHTSVASHSESAPR